MNRTFAGGALAVLFFLSLAAPLANASYFNNGLDSQLMAFYSFTGNADDNSGNGHHGTHKGTGTILANDRHGNSGSAYRFSGTGHIDTDLQIGNSNFISFWIKTSASRQLVMGPTDGRFYTWMFGVDSDGKIFYGDYKTNYGGHVTLTGNSVANDQWQHISVYQDAPNASLYLYQNGVLVDSYTETGDFDSWGASGNTGFGFVENWTTDDNFYGLPQHFTGCLDDIGFWERGLTMDEIMDLAGVPVPEPGTLVLLSIGLLGFSGISRKAA